MSLSPDAGSDTRASLPLFLYLYNVFEDEE